MPARVEPAQRLDQHRPRRRSTGTRDPPGALVDRGSPTASGRERRASAARDLPRSATTTSSRSPPTCALSSSAVPRAITWPWSMTTISSASRSASSRYCVVSSSVVPPRTRSSMTSHMPSRLRGSRPVVGSSRNSTGGRRPARRPGRAAGACRRSSSSPAGRRPRRGRTARAARAARCAALACAEVVEPADHVEVLEPGQVLVDRGVLPGHPDPAAQLLRRRGPRRPGDLGAPASGSSSVVSTRTVVVLPAPFGPSRPSTVPCATSRSSPSSAMHVAVFLHQSCRSDRALACRPPSVACVRVPHCGPDHRQ